MASSDTPLTPLVTHWLGKIKLAWDYKQREFGDDAEECMRFFDGPYDWLYRRGDTKQRGFVVEEEVKPPTFAMTVNKCAEMVQLFGPVLYHRNPVRQVNPRQLPELPPEAAAWMMQALMPQAPQAPGMPGMMGMDPVMQMMAQQQAQQQLMMLEQQTQESQARDRARAAILEAYLNYTPTALNLKEEARWAIDEALIKGLGCLWIEEYQPPGAGQKMIGSFYDSVDNLLIDSDMESLRDAKWIARLCIHPVWEVEDDYGLPRGTLRGNLESHDRQAEISSSPWLDYHRKKGTSNDLLCYWKIWSKMGAGGRLTGIDQKLREPLEALGDYCYLVVSEQVPYPLNLPPQLQESGDLAGLQQAVQWPTPFWADDAWPFVPISFHDRPRKVWPMSHLKPALGELKFINWMYSFVAGKIKVACRDFLAMRKSLSEDIKETILHGTDYELVQIEEQHGTISEVVQFLQHPQFHGDIWKVLEAVEANFEKRVGLTELMYGQTAVQMRSAQEAQVKSAQLQVRPDDMAEKVEAAMTYAARREALAIRWHLQAADVAPVLGPAAATLWDQLVVPSDPAEVLFQLEYRIEAGSVRKPNRDRDLANANLAMNQLFQAFWTLALQTGNVAPVNAVLMMWAKANEIEEPQQLLLSPPPPPMPPPGAPGGEGEGQQPAPVPEGAPPGGIP